MRGERKHDDKTAPASTGDSDCDLAATFVHGRTPHDRQQTANERGEGKEQTSLCSKRVSSRKRLGENENKNEYTANPRLKALGESLERP